MPTKLWYKAFDVEHVVFVSMIMFCYLYLFWSM